MSLARIVTIAPPLALLWLAAPHTAHAGKFPLFIIISDNPWMLALGAVLVVIWLIARSGGNDRRGIDCSGLICNVYSEVGLKVPRISWQQAEFGKEIEEVKDIKPGDWIFYVPDAGKAGYVSHVGIVTEVRNKNEELFIHASSSKGVREDNLYSKYFKNRFVKAMRPF